MIDSEPSIQKKAEAAKARCERDCRVLELLTIYPCLTTSQIGDAMGIDNKNIQVTLKKLEGEFLLWKVKDGIRGVKQSVWALRHHRSSGIESIALRCPRGCGDTGRVIDRFGFPTSSPCPWCHMTVTSFFSLSN